ncbi:hypothetical protein AB9T88_10495, partial [Flavobacterium sp. LBUM151]
MIALEEDLRQRKDTLNEFKNITLRVLNYLPHVLTGEKIKRDYKLHVSNSAGLTKALRPINQILFIYDPLIFEDDFNRLMALFSKMKIRD